MGPSISVHTHPTTIYFWCLALVSLLVLCAAYAYLLLVIFHVSDATRRPGRSEVETVATLGMRSNRTGCILCRSDRSWVDGNKRPR